jgi:PAS domain S-box-containing protein
MTSDTRRARKRFLSLYTMSVLLGVTAVVYVGAIGAHLSLRFRPAVQSIVRDSEMASERFSEFRERATHHEVVLRSLWAEWRARRAGLAAPDSLELLRRSMQRFTVEYPPGNATLFPLTSSPEFALVIDRATLAESALRGELLGAIAAVELGALETAGRMMVRADSLRAPLAAAVAEANDLAVSEVRRREMELVQITEEGTRIVLLWLLLGVLLFPVAGELLRRRIKQPLTEIDEGLLRLSRGDLAVQLAGEGDDELGRITRQVNRTVLSLRARFRADEERSTERSLKRARSLMDAALDAVVVVDAAGAIREWNPQASAMFGWEREQMIGVNLAGLLFPGELGDHPAAARLTAVLSGDSTALRQRLRAVARRGDGSCVPIELGLTAFASGEETEFAVFIRDVSGEAAAQDALMESEARYRAAFDQSAVGIAEVDPEGRVLRMNAALLAILGRQTPIESGLRFMDLLPEDQSAEDLRDFELLRSGAHAQMHRERVYRRPDGTTQSIDLTASTVRDANGQLSYFLVTAQDVSARAQLERDLRQAHKMDAVGQLAGGVAHDFNNILAGIIGYADLLEQEASATDSIRHEARAIAATAQRGADLAQKLLALARELPTSLVELDAREVVQEVHAIIKRAFDRNIELRLDMDDVPVGVRADRTQLSNALLNLCLNARDAMPRGGRLTMRARHVTLDEVACARFMESVQPGRYVALVVTDTGSGIARDVMARIFDPFFTTKEQGKGTGLGLAMVYGMVRAHDGVVDVESALGVGSTFSIYLPALERVTPTAVKAAAPKLVTGKGEVLLADDETTVREVAARMLRRLGYTVEAVSDGEQAVARFTAEPDRYAFVLLDGDMPRMHGRDAARHMRRVRGGARILLATGYLVPTQGDAAEASPFTAVLAKPYTLQELSRVISTHVGEAPLSN